MDTRLLRHYESELAFMRDMGAEFATAYPKIASRLGMEGVEVLDPYVERMLEGVAFLSARVQLELELQFPQFTSHLLEIVYPHYLAPTPSMMIARFEPDLVNSGLKTGYLLPRHTKIRSRIMDGAQTACEFRTAADVTMWPISIAEAEYIDSRGGLVAAGVGAGTNARAGIRLKLKREDGDDISDLPMDDLTLYLERQSGASWQLYEMLCAQTVGLAGRSSDPRDDWALNLPNGALQQVGLEPDEALLPTPRPSFDGYRLLQEYFAMPERFLFVRLEGLRPALEKAKGSEVNVYILLEEGNQDVGAAVAPNAFALNAVPAVNLFEKRCDRVQVAHKRPEQHVVPSRTAGLDFEIYMLKSVSGISGKAQDDVQFRPFYSAVDFTSAGDVHAAYYTQTRKMRQRSEKERLRGVRTSYLGSELYLTLVDQGQAPYAANIEQLAVTALCTNRDLPMLLSVGDSSVFHLPDGGPVKAVHTPVSPTRPNPTLAQGDTAWRLISHLSLNYLSIAETGQGSSASALRELIGIYAPLGNRVTDKQMEGIRSVKSRPIVRRMSDEVLSTAVRGLEITIDFDESFFEGTSLYVLGTVMERFFAKYATINSFTETVLTTERRGEIARWRPKSGLGQLV